MKRLSLKIMALSLLFLISCTCNFPKPKTAGCSIRSLSFDYNESAYALNYQAWQDFNNKISIYIPAENEPVFYIQSFQLTFCDHLELDLAQYSYQVESIANPDGWWYEVVTNEAIFSEILNGRTVKGFFKTSNWATEPPVLD